LWGNFPFGDFKGMAEEKKEQATKTVEWQPISQMSIKKIGCDAKDAVRQDKQVFMARIYGVASAVKTKEQKNGDLYSYLIGEFRSVNNKGEKHESDKLFLPGGILEKIEGQLAAANGQAVQFGYEIFANPDESVTVGYRYAATSIMKTEVSDRLAKLSAEVGQRALPTGKTNSIKA
jgi:hypothetical protein